MHRSVVRPATAMAVRAKKMQALPRRFASQNSHPSKNEEVHKFEDEGFKSPWWKYTLGAIGIFYLMGKYDDYLEKNGRVHPLTKFYASIMTDKVANRRIFTEYQKEVAKMAEFNILQWEEKREQVTSMEDVGYQVRTAKWGAPVGSSNAPIAPSKESE